VVDFAVRLLTPQTWDAYAALVERHHGVWGGCWCMEFHPDGKARGSHRQAAKKARVDAGTAHASLVFDGETCAGWCQYGPTAELPRIKHLRVYTAGLEQLPDWRITCFFVDKAYRGRGVAALALRGALDAIAAAGGGLVESYPELCGDRKVSSSFLHNGSREMFEAAGFSVRRPLGKNHWVVSIDVAPG